MQFHRDVTGKSHQHPSVHRINRTEHHKISRSPGKFPVEFQNFQ